MSGTRAAVIKQALVAGLTDALDGIEVRYGASGTLPRELVYLGRVASEQQPLAFQPGVGRRMPRKEQLTVTVHVRIDMPGEDEEAAEARACEVGGLLEDVIAAQPSFPLADGALFIIASTTELQSDVDDDGALALLTYTFVVTAHLT